MITRDNITAVVVWYHPTEEQVQNLSSYASLVSATIIVDNSETDHRHLLASAALPNTTYHPLLDNKGIAYALNYGCRLALQQGATWLLTMDQDSRWEADQWETYLQSANRYPAIMQVGVFSPRQDYASQRPIYATEYEEKPAVMTSGCLLSAFGFQKTDGFRDELFIDEVDNEYCFHCHQLGLQVVIINHAFLQHRLGEMREVRIAGFLKKQYSDHAPFRYYYMVRNNLRLSQLYPQYQTFNKKRLRKMLKRIFLYDHVHKWESLRMCYRGWQDFRQGRFGKLKQE